MSKFLEARTKRYSPYQLRVPDFWHFRFYSFKNHDVLLPHELHFEFRNLKCFLQPIFIFFFCGGMLAIFYLSRRRKY
jgi:hypothetical protein